MLSSVDKIAQKNSNVMLKVHGPISQNVFFFFNSSDAPSPKKS